MAKEAAKERKRTKYLVLFQHEDMRDAWVELGETEAGSATAAIDALAKNPGEFRAVPLSNWTPRTLGFEPPPPPKLVPVSGQMTVEHVTVGDDGYPVPTEDSPELMLVPGDPGAPDVEES